MSKTLVIVESPAKAKTISKYLGSDFIVKSSVGHIRDLPKGKSKKPTQRNTIPKDLPEDEKRRLKKINERKRLIRRMGIDPDNGWIANYEIIPEKEKVIKELKTAAKSVESIFLATDLDREGEAIAWHLKEALGADKFNYSRVRFNQITKDAILESFQDPKEIDESLVEAQQARRFLDRVVGFELSPLLWTKIARNLSAGRVQSVALRLLVEREHSIQKFKPDEFWEISFNAENDKNIAIEFNLNRRKSDPLLQAMEAKKIEELIKSSDLLVNEVTQKLYENGLITYMRTDAPALSPESIADARMYIETNLGDKYMTNAPRIYSSSENAQEAHEAIRPTNTSTKSESLISSSDEEKRLYELIWQQFIGSQLPDAEYLATNAKIQLEEYTFSATGREVVFDGFTRVVKSKSDDQDSNILPPLEVNQTLTLKDLENKQKYTKPPARFSEAALVKELEKRGIGRPSTYANIISTIQDRGYVEIQNRRFFVKKIGMIVTDRLISSFDDLMDYSFTANFENELDRIANGELNWKEVLNTYYSAFQDDLSSAMDEDNGMAPNLPTMTNINCPECKKNNLTIRNASNGVFLGCAGYTLPDDDQCKKTLNLISGDEAVSVDDQEEAEHLVA